MKKIITTLLIMTMALSLVACGGKETSGNETTDAAGKTAASETKEEEKQGIAVDEKLLTVDITLPASFFSDSEEEVTQESLEEKIADEDGIKSVKLNDDGSVTYNMTKANQREMLEDFKQNINDGIQEMVDDESSSFVSVTYNDDFTEFDVISSNEELNFVDSFSVITFYMYGLYYNAFAGNEVDDIKVVFTNEASGEVIQESSYVDWRENINSNE